MFVKKNQLNHMVSNKYHDSYKDIAVVVKAYAIGLIIKTFAEDLAVGKRLKPLRLLKSTF